ncbi:hypothetical protein JW887_02620 [Candidatus Dojkabacteria bacterium]|nr:hypothetical protein [Candidatus Dojkabacteria bacterium]
MSSLESTNAISTFGTIDYSNIPKEGLSRLQVSGTQVVNEYGQRVYLKGVNFPHIFWWGKGRATSAQAQYMSEWGSNICQITFNRYGEWLTNSDYRATIDDIIEWNTQNKIYTCLLNVENGAYYDWSSLSDADWDDWRDTWVNVATRYAGSTNVFYNLMDEPTGLTHQKYRNEMRDTIDAIRAIDPNMMIVVNALWGASDSWLEFSFETDYPLERSNILYDGHSFIIDGSSWWVTNHSKANIRDWLVSREWKWMKDNGRAVWCGSFGYVNTVGIGPTWSANWMEVINEDGYNGFAAWSWNTAWDDFEILQDWKGNPSVSGSILQEYLTS